MKTLTVSYDMSGAELDNEVRKALIDLGWTPPDKEVKEWEPKWNLVTLEHERAATSYNRILAYVAEFDSEWTPDWDSETQQKFFVEYWHSTGRWRRETCFRVESLGVVYMSKNCAEGLVRKLNSGEVEL